MDILEHIKELCAERDWTVYRLADEAGITQSTLTNMFYRKTLPSISTLMAICNAFNITLAQFFSATDTEFSITNDEKKIIKKYRRLTPKNKKIVDILLAEMIK